MVRAPNNLFWRTHRASNCKTNELMVIFIESHQSNLMSLIWKTKTRKVIFRQRGEPVLYLVGQIMLANIRCVLCRRNLFSSQTVGFLSDCPNQESQFLAQKFSFSHAPHNKTCSFHCLHTYSTTWYQKLRYVCVLTSKFTFLLCLFHLYC